MKFLILLCSLSFLGGAAYAQTLNVVSTIPANGAFAVDTDSIVITFDAKVDFDPFFIEDSDFSFFIAPEDSIEQLGARLSDDSLSVIFYGNLATNTDYVALLEYAEGINGEILETPYLFQFTTSQTGGQFVVEGYLTQQVLEKQLSSHEGNDVIVYLSYEPFEVEIGDDECMDEECDGDGDAEPVYAAFVNPTNGFYSIPGVREGTYYPIAIGLFFDEETSEDFFPEIYFYDPDEDFIPNSIDVNSTSAPNDTLSGIDLRKLEIVPITFSEALTIAQSEIDALENDPIIVGGSTFYAAFDFSQDDSEPEFKSSILKKITAPLSSKKKIMEDGPGDLFDILSTPSGYQIEWNIYGYDAVKDSAFAIISTPFGAEFLEYIGPDDAELPEGVEFTSIKPLPANFLDSDSAAVIIEAEGGAEFREMFGGPYGFWEMEMEALHRYWDYPEDSTSNAPVMWFGEYYGFTYDPMSNGYLEGYFIVILDIETGEVLYTDSEIGGFGETSHITFDEALELSNSFFEALPNDPVVVGGATNYSSFNIFFEKSGKKAPKQFQAKVKSKLEEDPFTVHPDGYAFSWEIYAYDAVKDSIFSFYVTESDIEFGEYVGEDDLEESIEFDDVKPLPENHIDSDSAAYLIDMEGGLAFRSMLAESELDWEWDMELQLLHQYWDYPLDPTPTAPVTWLGEYYAWAYDEVSEEYFNDSLTVYLDATTGAVLYSTVTVANEIDLDVPETIQLDQNYPNPFNPSTNIPFSLSEASRVEISVYSILGQKVATITDGLYTAGSHIVQWNAQNLSSGIYIYRMNAGGFSQTKKLILLK